MRYNPKPQCELLEELAVAVENTPPGEFDWSMYCGDKCGCVVNVAAKMGVAGLSWREGELVTVTSHHQTSFETTCIAFGRAFGLTDAEASAIVYANPLYAGDRTLLEGIEWNGVNSLDTAIVAKRVRDVARLAMLRYEATRPD